jgi:two-component system nitrogen regulation sensor histidine kinase NtrY
MQGRGGRHSLERVVLVSALLSGLPGTALGAAYLWCSPFLLSVKFAITAVMLGCWLGFAAVARRSVMRPLQTLSNLLLGLRSGDYSVRANSGQTAGPLGQVFAEINQLSLDLQTQRLHVREATALLRTVMDNIDVAIFAFDDKWILRMVNQEGLKLLDEPLEGVLGLSAKDINLSECMEGEPKRLLATISFRGARGRWGMQRSQFRSDGLPHNLLVISDLREPLREQELRTWQSLVRVLGHEFNNSLAPIKSIAGSLAAILERNPRPLDWEDDLRSGLSVIAHRSEGLATFLQSYSQLARLPQPKLGFCDLGDLAKRAVAMETRLAATILGGPSVRLNCDSAQVEQMLINLLKNATDAVLEQRSAGGSAKGVRVGWLTDAQGVEIRIEDDGPGVGQATSLFVPFFTTKPQGSGIGLVLCRQIAENHGGALDLKNRTGSHGCVAMVRLPVPTDSNVPI